MGKTQNKKKYDCVLFSDSEQFASQGSPPLGLFSIYDYFWVFGGKNQAAYKSFQRSYYYIYICPKFKRVLLFHGTTLC